MQDAIELSDEFERDTGITLRFVTLPENQSRAKITASVATESGEFDVVMISNFEAAQWASTRCRSTASRRSWPTARISSTPPG